MKSTNIVIALMLMLIVPGVLLAQFTNDKNNKVATKEKTNITSSRINDLNKYTNEMFIIDNAISAKDKNKVIASAKKMIKLSETEIARTENDLIDLYNTKPQTEDVRLLTTRVQERLKKEKQKYDVVLNTDFDVNDSRKLKQAMYAHNSMKAFRELMQENYNEIDKPKEKGNKKGKSNNSAGGQKKQTNKMISASAAKHSSPKSTSTQKPATEIQNYYNAKNKNIADLNKISKELSSALSSNKTEKVNSLKKEAKRKIKQIIADDNTLLRRATGGDPAVKGINTENLKNLIDNENAILSKFSKSDLSKNGNAAEKLLSDFMALPRKL